MNNEDCCSKSPLSLEESIEESPQMNAEEINTTINDGDQAVVDASAESTIVSTTPSSDDEISIEMGDCQPSDVVPNLIGNNNLPPFDGQPEELNQHVAEPAAEIPYAASPIMLPMIPTFGVQLSTEIQNVTNHGDMTQHDLFLLPGRETIGEPIQNEDEETIPVGTTDNSVADLPIHNEIDHFAVEPILEIEPTNDNAEILQISPTAAASPVGIDATHDDDGEQEVLQTQMVQNTELNSQPEDDPPDVHVPIIEITSPPVTAPSFEAADQNPSITIAVDNSDRSIETSAHLQIPILPSRTNKRSISSDEIHHIKKKHTAGGIKRWRKSIP